jgi:hypothetical protein
MGEVKKFTKSPLTYGLAGSLFKSSSSGGGVNKKAKKQAAAQMEVYNKGMYNLNPYISSGINALGDYQRMAEQEQPNYYALPATPTLNQFSGMPNTPGGIKLPGMPDWAQMPTIQDIASSFQNLPGYQERLNAGVQAMDRSAAARGTLGGGGYAKALNRYAQDYASNEFQNAYARAMDQWGQQYGQQRDIYGLNVNNALTKYGASVDEYNRMRSNAIDTYGFERQRLMDQYGLDLGQVSGQAALDQQVRAARLAPYADLMNTGLSAAQAGMGMGMNAQSSASNMLLQGQMAKANAKAAAEQANNSAISGLLGTGLNVASLGIMAGASKPLSLGLMAANTGLSAMSALDSRSTSPTGTTFVPNSMGSMYGTSYIPPTINYA